MVKGRLKDNSDEFEDWDFIDDYSKALDNFFGVPYKYRGLDDDLYDYKKLIEFLGINIIQEEIKAKETIDSLLNEEIYTDSMYDYDHVFNYRRLTLTSTFLAIHSTFEGRVKQFCTILESLKKDTSVSFKMPSESVIEGCISYLVKRFKNETRVIQQDKKERLLFRDVRNKLVHQSGIINLPLDVKLLRALQNRNDITAKPINTNLCTEYFIEIKKSTFLKDYIDLIEKKFKTFHLASLKL